jgi:DNA repair protein RecO (recombination protein O)
VRFEQAMLAELGFGLDLTACAATGARENLAWVSPKSGRAVGRAAGAPYADRLLALPAFLVEGQGTAPPAPSEIDAGFRLTGFFLMRDVLAPRGASLPDARRAFLAAVTSAALAPT